MRAEFEKWLEKAEKDLDTAEFNFKGGQFEASAFYSHQAAEKALKTAEKVIAWPKMKNQMKMTLTGEDNERFCENLNAEENCVKTKEATENAIRAYRLVNGIYKKQTPQFIGYGKLKRLLGGS